MKIQNHAQLTALPRVRQLNRHLVFTERKGNEWIDVPIQAPFAFDILSLRHGWSLYDRKTKQRDVHLTPASEEWTDADAEVMQRDGWKFLMTVQVASTEFPGGLSELEIRHTRLIDAVARLYDEYRNHPMAKVGKIPVVKHSADELGDHQFEIVGFTERKRGYGVAINPLP